MTLRLAVICDYLEEGWPSMDLVAEMLIEHGRKLCDLGVLRPGLPSLFPDGKAASTLERAFGRYLHYPAHVLARRRDFDAFHVVDHSYAHLLLALPATRAGVYCHDLEAFRAAFSGSAVTSWRRPLAELLLAGLRRAKVVFYSTAAVREEIVERGLLPAERLVYAPYGVSHEFGPNAGDDDRAWAAQGDYLLHVGSLVPRKNPWFLLELFAELAERQARLKFVQIGGQWSEEQRAFLAARGLSERVLQKRGISRAELGAAYRQARLLLLPSTVEGFGLPVIEALACGTPVLASDLAVLREVGGHAAVYCAASDLAAWSRSAGELLAAAHGDRESRLNWARRFSWSRHAATILAAYRALGS